MLNFLKNVKIYQHLDINKVLQLVNKGEEPADRDIISDVEIECLIDHEHSGLAPTDNYPLIYVICVYTKEKKLPKQFLEVLDRYIELPVIYKFCSDDDGECNYVLPIKFKVKDKFKIIRIFTSGWHVHTSLAYLNKQTINEISDIEFEVMSGCETIEEVYKNCIQVLSHINYEEREPIKDYIDRIVGSFKSENYKKQTWVDEYHIIDKGYNNYSSIKNSFCVTLKDVLSEIEIKSDLFDINDEIILDQQKFKYIFEADRGKVILYERCPSSFRADPYLKVPVEELYKRLRELQNNYNNKGFNQRFTYNEDEVKKIKLIEAYGKSIMFRLSAFGNKIIFNNSVVARDEDLNLFIVKGCGLVHNSFIGYHFYKFIEKSERKPSKNPRIPQRRVLTEEEKEEQAKNYEGKKNKQSAIEKIQSRYNF